MENKWIRFASSGKLMKLPQLLYAGVETVDNPSYCWDGKKRKSISKCVFQYTLEGYGCLSYRGNSYKVDRGKAFIYDLSDPAACYFYPSGETKAWRFVYCVFSNLEEIVEELNVRHGPIYEFGEKSFLVKKLISLLDSQGCQAPTLNSFQSYAFCAEIIGEMCRCSELRQDAKSNALVLRARSLIQEHRKERFSLKWLSSSLGVCPEHLCRVFKKHLNCTPKHCHDQLRIESICGMLACGNNTVKEIAEECGFDDVSNFNKFFKKHCSMAPGKFRHSNTLLLHNMFNG